MQTLIRRNRLPTELATDEACTQSPPAFALSGLDRGEGGHVEIIGGDTLHIAGGFDELRAKGAKEADEFTKDHRPWGWFESLVVGARFQVKRIVVHPGAALSLQSHHHRSEHWIVVEGTAKVTIDEEVKLVGENQSVYIPLGAVHRMENPGKVPMVLIEVQTGSYLGEDDIVRYEDVYARTEDD